VGPHLEQHGGHMGGSNHETQQCEGKEETEAGGKISGAVCTHPGGQEED
jgi:hypothetical protein